MASEAMQKRTVAVYIVDTLHSVQAKTMSFGFKAGEFLKADKISYAAKKEEYDPFFTSLGGKWGWDTVYVASEEEKKAEMQVNALLVVAATLLVIAPLGAFYYYWYYQC